MAPNVVKSTRKASSSKCMVTQSATEVVEEKKVGHAGPDSRKRRMQDHAKVPAVKAARFAAAALAATPEEECEGKQSEWDGDMHKMFVAAMFEIGLRNASPAVILENMVQKHENITSERVKSKLQKYRNNKEKSKQEFVEEYDSFLHKAQAIEGVAGGTNISPASPAALLEMMGSNNLLGGDAAAFLSYVVMKESELRSQVDSSTEGEVLSPQMLRQGARDYVENFAGTGIPFPLLTEDEKKSSLGVSMTFMMGLFLSMTQHLMKERAQQEENGTSSTGDAHQTSSLSNGQRQGSVMDAALGYATNDSQSHQMGTGRASMGSFLLGDMSQQQYAIQQFVKSVENGGKQPSPADNGATDI
jgi:SHAQKYF class myb-like DNA-binding protein